jgi:hypothetical protein
MVKALTDADVRPGMIVYSETDNGDSIWSADEEIDTAHVVIEVKNKLYAVTMVDGYVADGDIGANFVKIACSLFSDNRFYLSQADAVRAMLESDRQYVAKSNAISESVEAWLARHPTKQPASA